MSPRPVASAGTARQAGPDIGASTKQAPLADFPVGRATSAGAACVLDWWARRVGPNQGDMAPRTLRLFLVCRALFSTRPPASAAVGARHTMRSLSDSLIVNSVRQRLL